MDKALWIKTQNDAIEQEIENTCVDPSGRCQPIYDGIVDIPKYLSSTYKILWILKEPYDDVEDGKATGGGWHYINDYLNPTKPDKDLYTRLLHSKSTYHPIIYISYGILNEFKTWTQMEYIRDDKSMMDVINHIAIINVKKLPGLSTTPDYSQINDAYQKNRNILIKQIEVFNPNIIIGGNTLPLFYNDLKISKADVVSKYPINLIIDQVRILIDAYHPGQKTVKRELYVNSIVDAVKEWSQKK